MSANSRFSDASLAVHEVVRLDFLVEEDFEGFRARYESAVPAFSPDLFGEGDDWAAITERTTAAAPYGFLHYNRLDILPFFSRAGHQVPCTAYLMGNHVFAEQMFRHDPAVMLYAPLRVVIHGDAEGRTHFIVDQPSTRFGSFGKKEIAEVGEFLDDKLAELLSGLRASA